MKKVLGILLLLIVVLSCGKKQSHSFEVNGTIHKASLNGELIDLYSKVFVQINEKNMKLSLLSEEVRFTYDTEINHNAELNKPYSIKLSENIDIGTTKSNNKTLKSITDVILNVNNYVFADDSIFLTFKGENTLLEVKRELFPEDLDEALNEENLRSISIQKSTCLGHCPSYDLSIFDNGVMDYNGRKFTKVTGIHLYKADTIYTNELFKLLDGIEFEDINTVSSKELTDESIVTIEYNGKQVVFREEDKIAPNYRQLYEALEAFLERKELVL